MLSGFFEFRFVFHYFVAFVVHTLGQITSPAFCRPVIFKKPHFKSYMSKTRFVLAGTAPLLARQAANPATNSWDDFDQEEESEEDTDDLEEFDLDDEDLDKLDFEEIDIDDEEDFDFDDEKDDEEE